MSEDAYQPTPLFYGSRYAGKTYAMKLRMKQLALENGGKLNVCRYDREAKKFVTDEITFDMPLEEIIL